MRPAYVLLRKIEIVVVLSIGLFANDSEKGQMNMHLLLLRDGRAVLLHMTRGRMSPSDCWIASSADGRQSSSSLLAKTYCV